MSLVGPKPDVPQTCPELRFLAKSGLPTTSDRALSNGFAFSVGWLTIDHRNPKHHRLDCVMPSFLDDEILNAWHRLLQELELARNYHMPYMLTGFGGAFRNPVLDYLLPSLLYVKLAAILDEALVFYINHHGLTMPKKYKKSLHGRIEFLNDQGLISDYSALHKIRGLRNLLAHEVAEMADWAKLDADLNAIENELQKLGFVGVRPRYEYFGERSGVRECDEPGVAFAQDYRFGVKLENRVTMEVSFTEKTHNDSE